MCTSITKLALFNDFLGLITLYRIYKSYVYRFYFYRKKEREREIGKSEWNSIMKEKLLYDSTEIEVAYPKLW